MSGKVVLGEAKELDKPNGRISQPTEGMEQNAEDFMEGAM